ncbi:alkyl sulfatase dimerization domain-containing protein [Symmachiella macrocystis]|uniref:alkyl sulfatase dimerization domain-containing protein n=1 Tax=Symmachiella macrocystis TaxID=2527985 RepID=UPI0021BCC723|nr:alkyl sulfatase dimerization domain-containing protein [Symmachiella macrocystis]
MATHPICFDFHQSQKQSVSRNSAGGTDKLLAAAGKALSSYDNQWAAQLADYLLAIDNDESAARRIKADALTKLAGKMVNATARN